MATHLVLIPAPTPTEALVRLRFPQIAELDAAIALVDNLAELQGRRDDFLARYRRELVGAALLAAAISQESYHVGLSWARRWSDASFSAVDLALLSRNQVQALGLWSQRRHVASAMRPALAAVIDSSVLAWAVPGGNLIARHSALDLAATASVANRASRSHLIVNRASYLAIP